MKEQPDEKSDFERVLKQSGEKLRAEALCNDRLAEIEARLLHARRELLSSEAKPLRPVPVFSWKLPVVWASLAGLALAAVVWVGTRPAIAATVVDTAGSVSVTRSRKVLSSKRLTVTDTQREKIANLFLTGWAPPVGELASIVTKADSAFAVLGSQLEADTPALIAPTGPVLRQGPISFWWHGVAEATDYKIEIEHGKDPAIVLDAHLATNFSWSEGVRLLKPGETYVWYVTATLVNGPKSSTPISLYFLLPAQLSQLRGEEAACQGLASLLAALYESWGLYDDAATELQTLQSLNPGNQLVVKMIGELDRHRYGASVLLKDH